MARTKSVELENSEVIATSQKSKGLNLVSLAKLPSEFYEYNPFTSKLELCSLENRDFKNFRGGKENEIMFVLAVYNPLTLILDDNKEKADLPYNKPQLISIPLSSFKNSLSSMIKGFFQMPKQIIDKQTGENLGEKTLDYFRIQSTFELFAFASCLNVEDIIEPIKEKSKTTDSNATIRRYATEVVNAVKSIVIGTCQIPIQNVLHIPFHLEQNNGGAPEVITLESLQEAYQTILKR